ncbi:MAG: PDGLE domain-containing protein, partial [Deltaproteobacteria bacterium]
LLLMQPIHLAIGLVEGVVTAAFCAFVRKARPEILESSATAKPLARVSIGKVLVGIAIAALLTGGVLSWFASTYPDGLEWSIKKIYGKSEIPGPSEGVIPLLENVQEKTAILPDYGFRSDEPTPPGEPSVGGAEEEEAWPAVSSGTTSAGIVGSVTTLALAVLIGFILKRGKKA